MINAPQGGGGRGCFVLPPGSCLSPGRKLLPTRPELPGRRQAGVGFWGAKSSDLRPEHFGLRPEAGRSWIPSRILRPFHFGLRPFHFGLGGQAGDGCWRQFDSCLTNWGILGPTAMKTNGNEAIRRAKRAGDFY